jgi:hypothetical protein
VTAALDLIAAIENRKLRPKKVEPTVVGWETVVDLSTGEESIRFYPDERTVRAAADPDCDPDDYRVAETMFVVITASAPPEDVPPKKRRVRHGLTRKALLAW